MSLTKVASRHGHDAAIHLQRTMFDTVDQVGRVFAASGTDIHYTKGGTLTLARNPPQAARLEAAIAEARRFGFGDDDLRWLPADDVLTRCAATAVLGGGYTPHCAAVHPARLVHGLAQIVAGMGVRVYEQTAALDVRPGEVVTGLGRVRADTVVVATEAYSAGLPGRRRDLIPLYSLMVATAPLPDAMWDEIGLAGRPTFNDGRRMII
jgi:glycine/D-amino acid oxidase-like deaminating enzyme